MTGIANAEDGRRVQFWKTYEPTDQEIVNAVLEKVIAFDEIGNALRNCLASFGYIYVKQDGHWFVKRVPDGSRFYPEGGYHSLEDMLTAIIEDIKVKAANNP